MSQGAGLFRPGETVVVRYTETARSIAMLHATLGNPARLGDGSVFLVDGRLVMFGARPYVVVEDSEDLTILYQPPGSPYPRWLVDEQRLHPDPRPSRGASLRLLFGGRAYEVTLFFEVDGDRPWFFDALFGEAGLRPGWRGRRDAIAAALESPAVPGGVPGDAWRFRGWYVNLQTTYIRRPFGFDVTDQVLDIVVRADGSWYWKDEDELALAVEQGACDAAHADAIRRAGLEAVALIEAETFPFDGRLPAWRPPAGLRALGQIPDGWQRTPAVRD